MYAFDPTLIFLFDWLVRLAMVVVVLLRRRTEPSVALAWLALILAVPIGGTLIYLVFGGTRLGHRRIARHRAIAARVEHPEVRPPAPPESRGYSLTPAEEQLAMLGESVGSNIPLRGNRLELFGDTDTVISRLVADIDAARDHCHLLFYIYLADGSGRRVAEALCRAAQRGVACRLLVDDVGSRAFLGSALRRELDSAGVRVARALPANLFRMLLLRIDLRNHRKLAVIDGRLGWTGSQNIANADFAPKAKFAPWVDCMVRIEGPVVRDLQTLFVEDWFLDTDESLEATLLEHPAAHDDGCTVHYLPAGPGASRATMRLLVQAMVQVAREELVLTTPYFVPDEATLLSLCAAARRGVRVILVVPKRNDSLFVGLASRSFYEALLDAGVEIREFRAGLLHAKTVTVDKDIGLISTANLDRRSFDLNFETSLLIYDNDFSSVLRFLQQGYLEQSDHVDPRAWRSRPWTTRLVQNAAGLLGPLL